jgi:predicted RNA binding protein YcfA (HicA-like mRNA interferase family)
VGTKKNHWESSSFYPSHKHFIHPIKKGLVTVPHPKRDIPTGTLKSIEKQANIKFGEKS